MGITLHSTFSEFGLSINFRKTKFMPLPGGTGGRKWTATYPRVGEALEWAIGARQPAWHGMRHLGGDLLALVGDHLVLARV